MTSPASIPPLRRRRRKLHCAIKPATPRPHRRDCQGQLVAALNELLESFGEVTFVTTRPWCSVTFVGALHYMTISLANGSVEVVDAFRNALIEVEFELNGHLVADVETREAITTPDGGAALNIVVLTIEDW